VAAVEVVAEDKPTQNQRINGLKRYIIKFQNSQINIKCYSQKEPNTGRCRRVA
jgi:hypothetical protein